MTDSKPVQVPQSMSMHGYNTDHPAWNTSRCKNCGWTVLAVQIGNREADLEVRKPHIYRDENVWMSRPHAQFCIGKKRTKKQGEAPLFAAPEPSED